jgi:hypothetical protein
MLCAINVFKEEFQDTKEVIRIHISKKNNWETYDEKISLRSNTLCLELDVNTEIFNTEQEMLSELGLFVKSIQGSKFEDTKEVIRIHISKKNRQHYGHKKKYKRSNNDLQNIHIKLKIE